MSGILDILLGEKLWDVDEEVEWSSQDDDEQRTKTVKRKLERKAKSEISGAFLSAYQLQTKAAHELWITSNNSGNLGFKMSLSRCTNKSPRASRV